MTIQVRREGMALDGANGTDTFQVPLERRSLLIVRQLLRVLEEIRRASVHVDLESCFVRSSDHRSQASSRRLPPVEPLANLQQYAQW